MQDAVLGLAITALLGLLFAASELDLRLQAMAYRAAEPHWPLSRREPWLFLYRFSTWPGVAFAVAAAVGFGASYLRRSCARFRYPSLYLLLLFAVGPGLLVNLLGKALLGRPRPWELVQFGGELEFHRPFEPGPPGGSFSFLCSHCSMGFLFIGFFYLARSQAR